MQAPSRTVGVLALQGAFRAHESALRQLGVATVQVRTVEQLDRVDALVIPGGESTTMSKLLDSSGLFDPIAKRIADGMPTFGTCAGMILLATDVADGRPDQRSFAALDIGVRRNGFGRQIDSFEADIALAGDPDPFHAVLIRAPRIERCGNGVEVLAAHHSEPVLVRQGPIVAASFHPELTGDTRVHAIFLQEA
ncbi:MAG TPA: pyridoxal 5'-phosphate synthase glutaminase subunit PdxT [Ilumatobacteraceae bacterium]|nr:pyridoxal 5'-phosphate synthase glutaminase subunit PdxT [Ilumatobacteraceae bacterium]